LQEELRDARATRHDEAAASKEATGKTSRFFGVYWDKQARRWRAHVWRGGKVHNIGLYDDELAAARDVDKRLLANERRRVNLDADDMPLEQTSKTYSSIYVGVTKKFAKWRARIWEHGNKEENLGTYHTQKEAALAYDRRARLLGRGTNFRKDGTCNELGTKGKVVPQVEDEPGS
jgi:hypothetical protein